MLVNQLHAVRGQLKFDGWSIRIHSYNAYKLGKKRELTFYWHVKRNQFNVSFEKKFLKKSVLSSNRSSKDQSFKFDVAVTGFGQESNAIRYEPIYFEDLIQPNIFLMLVTSEQELAGTTVHSTGQTERTFPLVFLLDLQIL